MTVTIPDDQAKLQAEETVRSPRSPALLEFQNMFSIYKSPVAE
jgi:hypothetical protein